MPQDDTPFKIFYVGYGIYLGQIEDANNIARLKASNITHVLSLGWENDPKTKEAGIKYHYFDIGDGR